MVGAAGNSQNKEKSKESRNEFLPVVIAHRKLSDNKILIILFDILS